MAAAAELFDSRVGDVSADRSGFGASRMFVVTVDTIGDNPDDTLRDIDAVGADDAVPFGAVHPTRPGLFSAFYSVVRRLAAFKYICRVIYAPPLTFATSKNPWEFNYQPGFATETVRHDWLGVPIGPASYRVAVLPVLPNTELFTVTVPSTPRKPAEVLQLVRVDGKVGDDPVPNPIRLTSADRTVPRGSFSMSRTFPGMQTDTMASIVGLANIVNSEPFMGFPKFTVKFVGPRAQAGEGTIPETNSAGFIWRISLPFEWNPFTYRWRAQDEFHVEGQRLPVIREDGSPMIREWQLYEEADLNQIPRIVETFGSYIEPTEIGIQIPVGGP